VAETIRGINVVIGADTTKLSKALSDVNQKSKDIQSELRQVERLLKFDPGNTELLAQKQQLLSQAVANTNEKLNRLKLVQQQVADQFARGEISEGQYRAFQREIAKTEQELQRLEGRLRETDAAIEKHSSSWSKLQDKLNDVGQRMQDVGARIQSAGQNVAMSFGAASIAIGGALGFAAKKSMDFEAQMDRVGAISGANAEELKALEEAALELGSSTSKSATEVAQGFEIMATMGYNANQIIAAMPGVIAAAEASGEDMALVADTVSSALNAFGLEASEASRVADVLAQAANDSAAGIQDMQYTFKYAAPIAKSLGISLEELAAATEIMANNGIRGEQAGTTLRGALIRLSDPPKEAAEALAELGIEITDSQGKMRPFGDIIAQLSEKTKNMSNAQKLAALSTIFGTEAASGMLTVIEAGPQKLDALTKSLQNSGAASQEAAKKMKDNLKGALEELGGAFETAQITIGNALAPAIQNVAEVLQGLVDWFNNLSPSMQKFIAIGAAVAAVFTGIVASVGIVLAVIGSAVTGFGALATAIAPIGATIAGSFAPITGIILGVIALSTLLYTAWQTNFGGFRDFTIQVWNLVVQKFNEAKAFIMPIITELVSYITERWKAIHPVVSVAMNAIGKIVGFILPFIFDTIKFYLEAALNVFKGVFNLIAGVVKFFVALFTGDWKGMWEAIKQALSGAVQAIWGLFNLWFVGKIAGVIGSFINKGIGFFSKFVGDGVKWFTKFVSDTFSKISGWVSNMVSKISSGMANFGGTIGKWLGNVIKDFANFALQIPKKIGSVISEMVSKGKDIVKGIWEGIKSMGSWLADKISEWAKSVIPGPVAKALGIHSPSRVMRDEVGKWIPLGLAEGISRNISAVVSATNRMAQATIPSISTPTIPTMNIEANSARIANAPRVSNVRPAVLQIVTPDKRTIAQWLVDDITEFQEFNLLRERRFEGR
jgi:TP901 family phage tail tape measure protein